MKSKTTNNLTAPAITCNFEIMVFNPCCALIFYYNS